MDWIAQLPVPPFLFFLFLGLAGLAVGSFLNVVIHRLPIMLAAELEAAIARPVPDAGTSPPPDVRPGAPGTRLNLSTPSSRCPACGAPLRLRDNIPVLSFLLLRGQCHNCGNRIPVRYPAVEIVTAALFLAAAFLSPGPAWLGGAAILISFLICISGVDADHLVIPDDLALPLLWIGLLFGCVGTFVPPRDAILGAAAGYASLWVLHHLFHLLRGREGMGYGDLKLFAAIGAWFGWQALPFVAFAAAIAGLCVGIGLIAARRVEDGIVLPFGPFLSFGAVVTLFWDNPLQSLSALFR